MLASRRNQAIWGYLGAAAAAWFAIWMLFFPDTVAEYFAWNVHPRYAQAFIGAGYIFRTFFFLNAAREGNWFRLRWIVWGNLVFTGTLLLATYWHLTEFHWPPFETPLAHIWIVLYIFEPVAMVYLIPRGILGVTAPVSGGEILTVFRTFLVLITGLLLMQGLFLVAQPEFAATRWAWELNPLDARIVAAWFLGWSIWCGTMAFATDWDEIRTASGLFVLNGVALLATVVVFRDELLDRGTTIGYAVALLVMTGAMGLFIALQERRRPAAPQPADAEASTASAA
jgi:hypothetical protein